MNLVRIGGMYRAPGGLTCSTRDGMGEYLDDPEMPGFDGVNAVQYPPGDVVAFGLTLHPTADHYGVGYGELVACDGSGRQLAVLNEDGGWD